ncbi:pogo transposable element, putative [Talaromyces stipitatus ATCC 10500]|uniref:Pogo transposable element, putative n=1 Tax=Talaromyces stipitatus (strain ATCC 10500 / CBS 375.48 / QM 6759 / NRRL 1006) TaxID=441959 RepID=B8M7Q0_TALSN|nr:pogo transposable element, putative [Talaromyces stipitatus ATCC 10500]EED19603.1 pogo transposable element, putative [Talaromyces stipitatus ATCC 10500]
MAPTRSIENRKKLIEQEGLRDNAIRDLKSSKIQSGRKAARVYGLPRTSLQGRLKGRRPLAESNATKRKLTPIEEETLIKRNWANLLLANRGSGGPIERVGINWKSTFINCHPEVKSVYSRGFHYQRAKCEDRKVIQPCFELVRTTIAEYGIDSSDIYNFDETGFAMGLIKSAKVIIGAETTNKEAFVLQPGKREWVTAIEAVNSTGWHLPPYIIFKGKHKRMAWFEDDPTVRFQCSDNGWTTDKITLDWLQKHFIPLTRTRTVGRYRLLILDGHGSHPTPEFDATCIENNIISLCMPAHTSHLCQPLDVSIFSPLKKSYYKHVEYRTRLGFSHIDKLDFLEAFLRARTEAYKTTSIQNGFAATGLVPLNPGRVLEKLNIQLKTPTPPGSSHGTSQSQSSCFQTPSNPHELET